MAWTTPRTWKAGETANAVQMNVHVRDNLNYLYANMPAGPLPDPKTCCVTRSSNLTMANGWSNISNWNSEVWDTDTMHDLSTNPGRITIKTAGTYVVGYVIRWASNTTGIRLYALQKNGGGDYAAHQQGLDPTDDMHGRQGVVSWPQVCAVNDYFECRVYQASGGNLDINVATPPYFWALQVA